MTAVARSILQQLGLQPVGQVPTLTAAGTIAVSVYSVSISILDATKPGGPLFVQPNWLVTELAVTLPDADVLVGLDLLLECRLMLDGPGRHFRLDF